MNICHMSFIYKNLNVLTPVSDGIVSVKDIGSQIC